MRRTRECYRTSAYALLSVSPWFAANVELVPFDIAPVNRQVHVTYAVQDAAKHDKTAGAGLGYVDIFDFGGNLSPDLRQGTRLMRPGELRLHPRDSAHFAGDVLIGNFGDGKMNVFAPNGTKLATPMGP